MVIGFLILRRPVRLAVLIAMALALLAVPSRAADQIIKKDGSTVDGQILSAGDGSAMIQVTAANGGVAKFPIPISDIKSITMTVPPAVAAAEGQGVAPADVITALDPAVKQFAGLPADWVIDAMARLAEANVAQGHPDAAVAIYNQILQLYPGSNYIPVAQAGKAALSLKAGKVDEALAVVQPIVEQANKNIAPSPSDGALYARAFLVYGQALEAQKKPQQALEAYLTVKTMFYQNSALADQADQLAKNLRDANPGLGVP